MALLLFGSGCCALIYQIAWMREFRLIFGASTAASAAVLAMFAGGLGVGGLLLGPRADRHPRPVRLYAHLEAIVAVSAAATPFLLALVQDIYFSLGGSLRLGIVGGTVLRLALSGLVLAVPTIVMGGTLPAAARGVTRPTDVRRQEVAALYGLNTLGAVLGCVGSTFFLIEVFGTHNTLWLAAALNALVVMFARWVDRSAVVDHKPPAAESFDATAASTDAEAPTAFLLLASGVVGFAFFLMELVWYRMLGPLLGGSVFTFGLILAIALIGIGFGSLVYSLVGANRPASLSGFSVSCLLEAAAMAAAFALGDRLAVLAIVLLPLGQAAFGALVAGWTIVTTIVVLPVAIVAGYQFPLLIALFGRGRRRVGQQVGLAYAANTLGAIVGSLAGGFALLPWLSAPNAWRSSALCLVALGAAAAVLSALRERRRAIVPAAALAAATIVLLTAPGPTAVWRHSGIAASRAGIATITSPNQLRDWSQAQRQFVVWEADGVESSVALSIGSTGYAVIVNGKSDGSARADAGTQVMLGLLGAILHPNPRRSLVIGLGTGSTAGWLGAIPAMERVDAVELERVVLDVARECRDVNYDAMNNPKVHIKVADAREVLLTTREQYDLIASEPSNPFRAGIASLFTQEYYVAASERLSEDGLFLQWVQAYDIDTRTLRTVYATMASVFPYVETWHMRGADIVLVGAKRPSTYQTAALAARIQEEPYTTALRLSWRAVDLSGLLAHYLASDRLTRALAAVKGVDINTDDRNVVEFQFARSLGRDHGIIWQIRNLARANGASRPPLDRSDAVNWPAVDTAWVSHLAPERSVARVDPQAPPEELARQAAIMYYYHDGNLAAARAAWATQSRPAVDPNELAMLADVEAAAGSEDALEHIARLRAHHAGEADAMLAELRFAQRDYSATAAALESAFATFRRDPWALTQFTQKAVARAGALAETSPEIARRMLHALRQPFSVRVADRARLLAVAFLTAKVDFKGLCADAVGALEPHVPWNREFLSLRYACYTQTGDPRLPAGMRDLNDFLAQESLPLAGGMVTRTEALRSDRAGTP